MRNAHPHPDASSYAAGQNRFILNAAQVPKGSVHARTKESFSHSFSNLPRKFHPRRTPTLETQGAMTTRQVRRAAERKANKADKAAYKAGLSSSQPIESEEQLDALMEEQRETLQIARLQREDKQKVEREASNTPNPKGGPRTPEGKAISSLNNLKHGLTGSFRILGNESQDEFDSMLALMIEDNQPETATEFILIEKMAVRIWLSRRAQRLQDCALTEDDLPRLGVYLRYQTTNDRGFDKCLSTLNQIKKERIGFESQKARVRLANAQALHLEVDADIRKRCDIPTEGACAVPFLEAQELFARCLIDTAQKLKDRKVA
jgi:hypothetical protein